MHERMVARAILGVFVGASHKEAGGGEEKNGVWAKKRRNEVNTYSTSRATRTTRSRRRRGVGSCRS